MMQSETNPTIQNFRILTITNLLICPPPSTGRIQQLAYSTNDQGHNASTGPQNCTY